MNYYLITKWFGCFLINEKQQIEKEIIFPKEENKLLSLLIQIRKQQILEYEKTLSENLSPYVAEKRLQSIGQYGPSKSIFSLFQPNPVSYNFSIDTLYDFTYKITKNQVSEALSLPDYQVIQQVNALDELQHIANVLSERIHAWNMYTTEKSFQAPVISVLEDVEENQTKLKHQIELEIKKIAPNISEIVGPMIAARLLSHAGSLRKLAMLPSSSIQLLGAEKALFRFKKKGGKPPKHGVIFQHPYISKAPYKLRGKNARLLSAKIGIAAKADVFTKRFIAPSLKTELADQIKN